MAKEEGLAIGIDLGTTYSCVAVWQEQHCRVEIIHNDQGNNTTPSSVAFTDHERLIGDAAKNQAATDPENTIFDAKRLIGRKYSEHNVQKDKMLWPFKVVAGANDKPMIVVKYKGQEKQLCAEEVSSMILVKLRDIAEAFLEKPRKPTMDAGAIAGLNVIRIINEPAAAAIAYGLDKRSLDIDQQTKVDIDTINSLSSISRKNILRVYFTQDREIKRKNKVDISGNPRALRRLRTACERAKRTLSSAVTTKVDVDAIFQGIDFNSSISRVRFEEINMELFEECIETVEKCLTDAKMDKSSVHDVVLVGGSSRIPKVQQLLQAFFNGKDLCKSINPDEAVAYGAAVKAALLSKCFKNVPDLVLLDVTPLSLGVSVKGDLMSVVVPRNTSIPRKMKQEFRTSVDNQSLARIMVYEGERTRASDNNLLGSFVLSGFPPAPRGHPLYVSFSIDENGILSVSAEEKTTVNKNEITIINDNKDRLSAKEIERMIQEAKFYEAEDREFLKKANTKYDLDDCVYRSRNVLKKVCIRSIVRPKEKEDLRSAINRATDLLDEENEQYDIAVFEACLKELESSLERFESW
ncbi:probable mediator of RNA polymerase II transcription subunit 37c [Cajanus cajan]|uniref:probable mediator of RNA polymerase II transcription subunit 37c n=1 Tax=Cajanus cajan TaxID=3821 RepID=UPI0010FB3A30|nr:probable mediator of RNA polymerase II transcription subunit 37c [Cajanus cajan]